MVTSFTYVYFAPFEKFRCTRGDTVDREDIKESGKNPNDVANFRTNFIAAAAEDH